MSISLLGRIGPSDHTGSMSLSSTNQPCFCRNWHIYKTLIGSLPMNSTVICPLNVREERSAAGWQLERSTLDDLSLRVANHFLEHQISSNINSDNSWVSIYGACQIFQLVRKTIINIPLVSQSAKCTVLMGEFPPCFLMRSWCLHP